MMVTETAIFPTEFADLEPFADWSIEKDHDRYQKRLASSIGDMQALYDALVPRAPAAMEYLDQFDLKELPDDALRLLWLLYSLTTISFAVDIFKQPRIPDSGSAYIQFVREPSP
ncbi:hypothetical protein MMAN_21790 [Mycobacterium mantenii]|uniref:Xaa-Pro dipeptidase n=1 Tax=Mycobacterium mantenii TaxID=560555 RepID=A0A1X0FNE3_MYCNT|nr:hypothetical protein BST30_19145 [Mycobacterium mantenii]BBY38045.1 hypothetical protein MMAN_21790 [Mycobacterium mantenii]